MMANPERVIDRAFVDRQQVIRRDLLAELYAQRFAGKGSDPFRLTRTLGFDPDECGFALHYLFEKGWVSTTGVMCRLTASGIERFEREWQ